MTTTSDTRSATPASDRRRERLERLLQITAQRYNLRFAFGDRDALGDGRVVVGAGSDAAREGSYPPLRGRALHLLGHLLSEWKPAADEAAACESEASPSFRRLWHSLEDARLENWMTRRWPGMAASFRSQWPRDLPALHLQRIPVERQLEWGLYLAGRRLPGPKLREDVQQAIQESSADIERGADGEQPGDSLEAFKVVYPRLSSLLGAQAGFGGSHGDRSGPVALPPDESESGEALAAEGDFGIPEILVDDGLVEARSLGRQRTMPEWYRPGSAPWFERGLAEKKVHPSALRADAETIIIPPRGDAVAYRAMWTDVQRGAGFLMARLLRLLEEETYLRYGGRFRTGKVEMNRLWKQRLSDYRLFRRRVQGGRRELAVSVLVDESASMQGREKYRLAAKAAILVGECLSRLEIPLEIIGFSTAGFEAREAMRLGLTPAHEHRTTRCSSLEHRIYKAFHEPYRFVRTRLTGIQPRCNNWDEEHLLFAYRRLRLRREPVQLLLVISDGQPNGDADHLIRTASRLEKEGCRVVGVGIGEDFVRRIYRDAVVVSDVREMGQALLSVIGAELGLRGRIGSPVAAGGSATAW